VDSEYMGLFEEIAGTGVSTTLAAVTLTEDLTKLRRDGVPVDELTDDAIKGAFHLIREGLTVKESIPDVLTWLAENPDRDGDEALRALGLEMLSREELEELVKGIMEANQEMVESMGMKAMGRLMGMVMGRVRGRAQPSEVQEIIRKTLQQG